MITEKSSLSDVCFAVSTALEKRGMPAVLTGGSAAALYAPKAYMSRDADFVLDGDDSLDDVALAIGPIGFARNGRSRIFSHRRSEFTVDFPKGPLAVGAEYVRMTSVLERDGVRLRILTRTDCIRDRLAHFDHWKDYTALKAAVGVAVQDPGDVDVDLLRAWTERESPEFAEKFAEFERRVRKARGSNSM